VSLILASGSAARQRMLEDAGLVVQEKRGRTRNYRLDRDKLRLLGEWLDWFDGGDERGGKKLDAEKV